MNNGLSIIAEGQLFFVISIMNKLRYKEKKKNIWQD